MCDTEIEIVQLYEKLSKGGGVLMPLDHYPFSKMFSWIVDNFGIYW